MVIDTNFIIKHKKYKKNKQQEDKIILKIIVARKMIEKLPEKFHFTWKKVAVWLIILMVYTFIGTFIFVYLEECRVNPETKTLQNKKFKNETINSIKLCAEIKEIVNFKNATEYRVYLVNYPFLNNLCAQTEEHYKSNETHKVEEIFLKHKCNILNSTLISKWSAFCLVSILTIGYGDVVPKTTPGKILTIVYILIGIPLALCFISNLSDNLLSLHFLAVDCIEKKLFHKTKPTYFYLKAFTLNIVILVVCVALMVFLLCMHDSSLSTFDSFYFVIVTMTTVGYGDFSYNSNYLGSISMFCISMVEIAVFLILLSMFGSIFNLLSNMDEKKKFICSKNLKESQTIEYNCPFLLKITE
ncbi:potassium channel subfamily K member 2 [Hydra vulgaris]|uniref:Potassium channel subfamily K member 2 n=1 Tax=Hydra vulgaris TaxID=6087 RepID=A0ABM4BHA3_HYDVU